MAEYPINEVLSSENSRAIESEAAAMHQMLLEMK
jgi:hypothetical protein